jgi:hypothetical protein
MSQPPSSDGYIQGLESSCIVLQLLWTISRSSRFTTSLSSLPLLYTRHFHCSLRELRGRWWLGDGMLIKVDFVSHGATVGSGRRRAHELNSPLFLGRGSNQEVLGRNNGSPLCYNPLSAALCVKEWMEERWLILPRDWNACASSLSGRILLGAMSPGW